jgi:hypothetical protein
MRFPYLVDVLALMKKNQKNQGYSKATKNGLTTLPKIKTKV